MILVPCPVCGPSSSTEFSYVDEQERGPGSRASDVQEARKALYFRKNGRGTMDEIWQHTSGCRELLVVQRDRMTNVFGPVALARLAQPGSELN